MSAERQAGELMRDAAGLLILAELAEIIPALTPEQAREVVALAERLKAANEAAGAMRN